MAQMNIFTKQKQTHRLESKHRYPRGQHSWGGGGAGGESRVWIN